MSSIILIHTFVVNVCRMQKRQRVVDVLLQVMVESIGFTVSNSYGREYWLLASR